MVDDGEPQTARGAMPTEGRDDEDEEEDGEGEDSDEEDDEEEGLTFGVLSGRLVSQVLLVLIGVILGVALTQPERFSVAFIARGAAVDEMLPPSPPRTVPFDEDYEDAEADEDEDEDDEMHADWMREQGWERHVDPTNGKPFYHHAASQVSQWERPTTSPASPAEAGEDELPSGWSSATDPDTGRPYFWSDSSRETTTWVHPRRKLLKAGWEEHCSMAKVSPGSLPPLRPPAATPRPTLPSGAERRALADSTAFDHHQALGRRREALLLPRERNHTVELGASQLET